MKRLLAAVSVLAIAMTAAARDPLADRRLARARQSVQKGDYWPALRDLEALLRAEPAWPEALRLRRTAGYEAHYREALRLIARQQWIEAQDQLENARAYGGGAELSSKLRLVRSRLAREENGANFAAARDAAREMLARSDFDGARARLQECLLYEPGDLETRASLDRLERRAAAVRSVNEGMAAVTHALAAGDWRTADEKIRGLPDAAGELPASPNSQLLTPLRLYTEGRIHESRAAAVALPGAVAHPFLLFLNSRARRSLWLSALPLFGGFYTAVLLLSLYAGLCRESLRGSAR